LDTKAWALASLVYREDDMLQLVRLLFPTWTSRFWTTHNGSHFFGLVLDTEDGVAYQVNRGTGGYNFIGKLASWMYDVRIFKNRGGVHKGFAKLGDDVFNTVKDYLNEFPIIVHTGTSQGAGVSNYVACLSCENLKAHTRVQSIVFASPPTGDKRFAERAKRHIDSGKLECRIYVNPQDPIASKKLRDQTSIFLNGVDAGDIMVLPDINRCDRGPLSLVNHSCSQYNAAYTLWLAGYTTKEDEPDRRIYRKPFGFVRQYDYKLLALLTTLLIN
jgi:hypothetical protein